MGTLGTNGLNADNSEHHFLSSQSFLLYKQVRSNSSGRVVVLRGGLSLTGGAELQDGGGIARAGGLASKVQKCATHPVKRSGIAEGP